MKKKIRPDWPKRYQKDIASNCTLESLSEKILRQKNELYTELKTPEEREWGTYIVTTSYLSYSLYNKALLYFQADEIDKGWAEMVHSFNYSLVSFKFLAATKFFGDIDLDYNHGGILFCTALTFKSRAVAEWTNQFILATEANPTLKMRPKEPHDFQCLVYKLATEMIGQEATNREWEALLYQGIYGPLLSADSYEAAQAAISELVVDRGALVLPSGMDFPPFELKNYELFPGDIHAILLMRDFDMMEFDFGHLDSPLCHPPVELDWQRDDLVQQIEARGHELFEEFPDVVWS